jgi:uncharacterized protein YndB with AHSA1/START domain
MKILIKTLLVLGLLVAFVLIGAALVKSEYAVEREVTIHKPRPEVFKYVKFLKNQDNYSVWSQMDPNSKKTYTGIDGTVGFIATWDSKNENVGKGEQEITKIVEGERIDLALRFQEPFETNDMAYMVTEDASDGHTKVKWGFNGKMKYPMNLLLLFMDMEGMLGKDLQQGLDNLKAKMESMPAVSDTSAAGTQ